ncbi:MAG: hypothetical protein NT049_15900 [Planctomycetota bacterium]|nr:hypothetical protein [Planctomycetota bacterium]
MVTERKLLIAAVAGILLANAAGCGQATVAGPRSGTVVGYDPNAVVAKQGPGAILVESEGQTRTLFSLYNHATVLVFTDEPCLDANSDVVRYASSLGRNVSLIEVAGPADNCAAHATCALERSNHVGNLISLCDSAGIVRQLYRVQTRAAILVLDENGFVHANGSPQDFEYYREYADNLARLAEHDRWDVAYGDPEY